LQTRLRRRGKQEGGCFSFTVLRPKKGFVVLMATFELDFREG
jgi:hypothetical protein